jgi:hypothetical protein
VSEAVQITFAALPAVGIVAIVAYQVRGARRQVARGREVDFAPSAARRQQGSRRPVPPDPPEARG